MHYYGNIFSVFGNDLRNIKDFCIRDVIKLELFYQ